MALTAYGADAALTGAVEQMKYVNCFSSATFAPTSNTAIGSSVLNMTGSEGKGYTNGKMVYIDALTASVTGLVAKRTYFVVGAATNSFELAEEEGGAGIKVAGAELTTAATKFTLLTELSGGSNARVATKWKLPVTKREATDENTPEVVVPAGKEITHVGWFDALTVGKCRAVEKLVTPEPYGSEGKFVLSADKLESSPLVS